MFLIIWLASPIISYEIALSLKDPNPLKHALFGFIFPVIYPLILWMSYRQDSVVPVTFSKGDMLLIIDGEFKGSYGEVLDVFEDTVLVWFENMKPKVIPVRFLKKIVR